MRAACLLAGLVRMSTGQPVVDASGRFTTDPAACAQVDMSQSNGWHDSALNRGRFSVRIVVRQDYWVPHMKFVVTWDEFPAVDQQYGVQPYEGGMSDGTDEHSLAFELPPGHANLPAGDILPAFTLMGRDTKLFPVHIACNLTRTIEDTDDNSDDEPHIAQPSVDVPIPDCELGAHWQITNPYPKLTDVEMRIARWEPGRVVTLTFEDELLEVKNVQYATVDDTVENGFDTVVSFKLGGAGTGQVCQTGHVDEHGAFVRDTNCGVQAGSELPQFFSFQLKPGPSRAPQVKCTLGPPPPPPTANSGSEWDETAQQVTSMPTQATFASAPLPHSARKHPPPAPPRVEADAACQAGGIAVVEHATHVSEMQTLRINVSPKYMWPTGFGYVVRLKGLNLRVSHIDGAVHAEHFSEGAEIDEVQSHVFLPQPSHANFGFNVEGVDVILVSLSCRCALSLPPYPCPLGTYPVRGSILTNQYGLIAFASVPSLFILRHRLMSPPPSPPVLLSPPPPEPPVVETRASFGLRSFSSRASVGFLALLIVFLILQRVKKACCGSGNGKRRYPSSAIDNMSGGAEDEGGSWSVRLDLAGQSFDIPLPHSVASNAVELKQALAELACEVLGAEAVPASWMRDEFSTMRVTYEERSGRQVTMHDDTDIAPVYASNVLKMSKAR